MEGDMRRERGEGGGTDWGGRWWYQDRFWDKKGMGDGDGGGDGGHEMVLTRCLMERLLIWNSCKRFLGPHPFIASGDFFLRGDGNRQKLGFIQILYIPNTLKTKNYSCYIYINCFSHQLCTFFCFKKNIFSLLFHCQFIFFLWCRKREYLYN